MIKFTFLMLALLTSACAHQIKLQPVNEVKISPETANKLYQSLLTKFVNKKGQVDFEGLQKDRRALDRYVYYVSKKPLTDFANGNEKLAHMINAYNALSMHLVIEKGIPNDNSSTIKRAKFFYFPKYEIGGEVMSLYSFENDIIRKIGDERIHFALNCMAVSCPRLPQEAFTGEGLDKELNAASKEFFASSQHLKIDQAKKELWVSSILDFFTEDFVPAKAKSLQLYVKKWLPENSAPSGIESFEVEFIDYDWTINNSNRLK